MAPKRCRRTHTARIRVPRATRRVPMSLSTIDRTRFTTDYTPRTAAPRSHARYHGFASGPLTRNEGLALRFAGPVDDDAAGNLDPASTLSRNTAGGYWH